MELYVRATRNDHTVIDHFLTPASTVFDTMRQPIGAVVTDANVAVERPQLKRYTADAGVPYVIDPLTPLMQSEQASDDAWARLPFAHPEPLAIGDLSDYVLDELVDQTITFQREHGATDLIPPYFYSGKRHDAWWRANLAFVRRTASYLDHHGIDLPVLPVVALSLREYGPSNTWGQGIDAYLDAIRALNADRVALSWSWNDPAKSKDATLSLLLGATSHAASRHPVIGWRSGTYGLALSAAGASGYETGIGSREYLHYVSLANSKKPRTRSEDNEPRAQAYVYLSEFGRSVPRRAGQALLDHPRIAASLVCSPDNLCCLDGAPSMITSWREHAVRERRRELDHLASMPPAAAWRLHHVEQRAERAHTLSVTANEVLERAGVDIRIPADTFGALQRVVAGMRAELGRKAA